MSLYITLEILSIIILMSLMYIFLFMKAYLIIYCSQKVGEIKLLKIVKIRKKYQMLLQWPVIKSISQAFKKTFCIPVCMVCFVT